MKRAFGMVYYLGMLAEMAIRLPHERRRRQTRMVIERVDWSERSLLGLMFVGMFFIPLVYTFTSRLDGADYRLPREARGPTGGVTGRRRSSYARGTSSSPKACTDRFGTRCTLQCGCGA